MVAHPSARAVGTSIEHTCTGGVLVAAGSDVLGGLGTHAGDQEGMGQPQGGQGTPPQGQDDGRPSLTSGV